MREAGSHRIKIQICLASCLSSKTMKKGIIQNFQFYEDEKLFKNGKNIRWKIPDNLLRFCKILWSNIQTRGPQQFMNLNEIFDGQEQQSNSDVCLNQEIQYTFISSWNCDCSLWLKVKSFHENVWKHNLSKQKHHMLLLFPWFLEHFPMPWPVDG